MNIPLFLTLAHIQENITDVFSDLAKSLSLAFTRTLFKRSFSNFALLWHCLGSTNSYQILWIWLWFRVTDVSESWTANCFCLVFWLCVGFVVVVFLDSCSPEFKRCMFFFSSVQSLGSSGGHEGRFSRDRFPDFCFTQGALVSSSCMGRDSHYLMLTIQHLRCQPWRRLPSKVPWRMVLERPSWHVTCPNHASFRLLTVAGRGS